MALSHTHGAAAGSSYQVPRWPKRHLKTRWVGRPRNKDVIKARQRKPLCGADDAPGLPQSQRPACLYEIPIRFDVGPPRKPMRRVALHPSLMRVRPGSPFDPRMDLSRFAFPKTRTNCASNKSDKELCHVGRRHAGPRLRALRVGYRLRLRLRTALRENDHDLRLFARRPRLVGPAVLFDLRTAAARAVLTASRNLPSVTPKGTRP
jgi:hypothetical protein